jgi:acetylornithine deacetylase/succinyl-diaminopimelate desuccinylase-like protein
MKFALPTAAHSYLDVHWPANLDQTRAFLRQPSISAQSIGLRETAGLLRSYLDSAGAVVDYYGPSDCPIVYACWDVGAPRTLVVYGMYDVQPVDNQTWSTQPFDAEIWEHPEGGESIVARGACNSKGPLMAFLHAIKALHATSGLPVNIKWTIEGEEEMGSTTLPGFYAAHRDMLRADAAFEPFWGQNSMAEPPVITLGTKGVVGLEFVSRAGEWGGPREVIHSSVGTWVASPAWRLMQALTSMVNRHQELVVDGIPPLGVMMPGDRELLQNLAESFDAARALDDLATARFKRDLPAYDLLQQMQFAPVLNVNGLHSGYMGDGSHTIIPHQARALCDLRLAPGMQADTTITAIRRHLARQGFGDIEINVDSGYPAARTSLDAPVVQALVNTYRAHGYEPRVRPIEPSATPYYLYTDVLGLDFSWGGLGAAGGSHAPDEWCSLAGLRALQKSLTTFLTSFALQPAV